MVDNHTILTGPLGYGRITVTARRGPDSQWLVMFVRTNSKRKLLDQCAAWLPDQDCWDDSRWQPNLSPFVPPAVLQQVVAWLRARPTAAEVAA
jgi:hypothetical protein